jgi:hypothetical protein
MGLRLNCSRGFAFSRWAKKQAALQWTAFPAVEGQSRMNPAKFCNQFRQRRRIAGTGKHVFAVINGVVHVEAPPDCGRCIYGAWEVVGRSTSERPIPHITAFPRTS